MNSGYIGFSEKRFGLSEALAIYMLQSLKEFSKYEVLRVITKEQMQQCDVLVGVGDLYSPSELRFSHYNDDFDESMCSLGILKSYKEKLSTAGLVFAVYGLNILKQMNPEIYGLDENNVLGYKYKNNIKNNYRRIYEYFIEVLDCFTWSESLAYPTPEKNKLMDYLVKTSQELETALSVRRTDYASIVDIYSGRIGNKFRDTLQWFYTNYQPAYRCLNIAFDKAIEVDPSEHIVVCDQQLNNVTVSDLVERITSNISKKKPQRKILVIKSKDKYRVECLKYTKLDKSFHFPCAGIEIYKIKQDLGYLSDDKTYAIMKTLDSAIKMAKALLFDNETLSKKNEKNKKNQAPFITPPSSCSIPTSQVPSTSSSRLSKETEMKCLKDPLVDLKPSQKAANLVSSAAPTTFQSTTTVKKPLKKSSCSPSNNVHPTVEVHFIESYPADPGLFTSPSSDGLHNFVFQVINPSAHQSTEKLIEIEADNRPSSVSIKLDPKQASLSLLTRELRDKYPQYSNYSLAFKDSNGRLMELLSNPTTQSAGFWASATSVNLFFVDLEAERSASCSSATDTYDEGSELGQSSSRFSRLCDYDEVEDPAVGIALDSWDLSELLAAAILQLSIRGDLKISSITSPNCVVRLGPGPYSYEDPMHRYTRKEHISMHQLGHLKCKRRLSCSGIAFGIHGLASIEYLLQEKFLNATQKMHIFRRLYGRLIGPVDEVVNGGGGKAAALQYNGLSSHSSLATKEAQILEKVVSNCLPKNGGNDLARNESEKISQFETALHFTKRFYKKFVDYLYNEIETV